MIKLDDLVFESDYLITKDMEVMFTCRPQQAPFIPIVTIDNPSDWRVKNFVIGCNSMFTRDEYMNGVVLNKDGTIPFSTPISSRVCQVSQNITMYITYIGESELGGKFRAVAKHFF
jgi:hypothetical protein